jgi:hypothetical protein
MGNTHLYWILTGPSFAVCSCNNRWGISTNKQKYLFVSLLSLAVLHGRSDNPPVVTVHPQNVRFQNVWFQNVRFQTSETSGLQNVRFTKHQVYKMSGLQNVRSSKRPVAKKHPYIFCACGWWKSAGSVAALFAGKVMAVFYSLF